MKNTPRGFAALGLYQPKNPANVGSVLRAAGCYGAALVVTQGERFKRAATDTLKAWRHIPMLETDDLWSSIPYGAVPVAIEFIQSARPLTTFVHPESAFYILGPEDGSIPAALVAKCKHVVYVPTDYCMNLAATANVVLYDRMMKRADRPIGVRGTA